jgi:hypothetical protein
LSVCLSVCPSGCLVPCPARSSDCVKPHFASCQHPTKQASSVVPCQLPPASAALLCMRFRLDDRPPANRHPTDLRHGSRPHSPPPRTIAFHVVLICTLHQPTCISLCWPSPVWQTNPACLQLSAACKPDLHPSISVLAPLSAPGAVPRATPLPCLPLAAIVD